MSKNEAVWNAFHSGLRDGTPIGLGYLAVSFSLGIAMRNAGMTPFQGFLMSILNNASAGEYAGVRVILADASYLEIAVITLITNARYLLMSASLSQKFSPDTGLFHRLLIGYDVTDELFGIGIAQKGYLQPAYYYGAMCCAVPGWAFGTAIGIAAGNILPANIVSALSVALYGMFIAIIIPPARENKTVGVLVVLSFLLSYLCGVTPFLQTMSDGTRTILLTVLIAGLAAYFRPIREKEDEHDA
ncbi:MAG: AzlC family ABC transporter permease [Solobacterium sp.]|nr:AzlC family ABC transporter permease [Solobacterium sp.]